MDPEDTLLEHLGATLRRLRTARGLSIKGLAEGADLSVRFVSDVEGGRGNVSVRGLSRLARALSVPVHSLLEPQEAAPPASEVVALVGLRGAGKSTIGPKLAARLRRSFYELDTLVETAAGLSLAEIFALHGDAFYRRLETATLTAFLKDHKRAVLATGGGIVTNALAFDLLHARSTVVWLKASPHDHWSRVVRQGDRRPMRANPRARAELKALLRAREPLYRRAHHLVDTSELGVEGAVETLAASLGR